MLAWFAGWFRRTGSGDEDRASLDLARSQAGTTRDADHAAREASRIGRSAELICAIARDTPSARHEGGARHEAAALHFTGDDAPPVLLRVPRRIAGMAG